MGVKGKGFEDLEVWCDARALVKIIYTLTTNQALEKDWALRDQIRRAALSIMANIAEGSERGTNNEFTRFLDFSIASTAEVKNHLYVALDMNYISEKQFAEIVERINSISRQLKGFKRYLRSVNPTPKSPASHW